jgi:type IV pilus assembly protein PilC
MVVQMLAVGQQAGQLEDMLEQLADAYDRQVDVATQRLTAVLEPVLIVCLAVMVGFIAFAIIRRRCRCLDCGQVRIDKEYP